MLSLLVTRRDAADCISDCARPQIRHLLKIYLFPDCIKATHWKDEVYGYFHDVPRIGLLLKIKPSSRFIFRNAFNMNRDMIPLMYSGIAQDYSRTEHINQEGYINEFIQKVNRFYTWLSDKLSRNSQVSREEMFKILDELGF